MAKIVVEVEDRTPEYLKSVETEIQTTTDELGKDLQTTAQQAAPEKTGNLASNITVSSSGTSGAYQADIESTAVDPRTGNDYVNWMHNGNYNLGSRSKGKGKASSPLGGFNKKVGREYLQGSGALAKEGYKSHMEKRINSVNMRYGS